MTIHVSRTPDGQFTISLNHGDHIVETREPEAVMHAMTHYLGWDHDPKECPLCVDYALVLRLRAARGSGQ